MANIQNLQDSIEALALVCNKCSFVYSDGYWTIETPYGYGTSPTFLGVVDLGYDMLIPNDCLNIENS